MFICYIISVFICYTFARHERKGELCKRRKRLKEKGKRDKREWWNISDP